MQNLNKTGPNGDNSNTQSPSSKSDSVNRKRFFIDNVARFCDKCGLEYREEDVHIVQESRFSSIVHFSCPGCKSNHIATFIKPMGMSNRVPINTDLNVDEISSFASKPAISSDDVLEIYAILEEIEVLKSF
ncbi:hypothetical protein H6764_02490 [Candidatus Nomurabacteria bacterium]|nr:hypothetical protein [Candidatus Nomurabacteria bacterium]